MRNALANIAIGVLGGIFFVSLPLGYYLHDASFILDGLFALAVGLHYLREFVPEDKRDKK